MSYRKDIAITVAAITAMAIALVSAGILQVGATASSNKAPSDEERYFSKTSGKAAWADWHNEDEVNGILTDVYIEISDRTNSGTGLSYPRAEVEMSVNQYQLQEVCYEDEETGEQYCYYDYVLLYSFFGYKELRKSDFSIATNLGSAKLNTEITGYAYYCEDEEYCPDLDPVTLSVNASWTGIGETYKGRDRYTSVNEFERVTQYSTGFFKEATSEIDIVGEDIEFHFDGNSEYDNAHISKTKSGYFERISYYP